MDVCASVKATRPRLGLVESLLYRAAVAALRRSKVRRVDHVLRTCGAESYRAWRAQELGGQLRGWFDVDAVRGLSVLDFGCGTGELCCLLSDCGARGVVGLDVSAEAIRNAQCGADVGSGSNRAGAIEPVEVNGLRNEPPPRVESRNSPSESARPSVRFLHAEHTERIPCSDETFDLICCFDVLEHVQEVPAIVCEWRRVLRPGGRVWIWWSPWRGPFGHHLDSLIPLPWVHLVFPETMLFRICADVYDHPEFVPRRWDIDPATGTKKFNKWRQTTSFQPFLNKLTRKSFEESVRRAGLRITRRKINGFSGSAWSRLTRVLLPAPVLGDCFVSFYVYELNRPEASQGDCS